MSDQPVMRNPTPPMPVVTVGRYGIIVIKRGNHEFPFSVALSRATMDVATQIRGAIADAYHHGYAAGKFTELHSE